MKRRKKIFIFIFIIIILLLVILGIKIYGVNNDKLLLDNDKFSIIGSINYNDDGDYIYISDIVYYEVDKDILYKDIECILYEDTGKKRIVIGNDKYQGDELIKLDDYLKEVTFILDENNDDCIDYSDDSLYIEINTTDNNLSVNSYKVLFELEEICPS